MITTLLASRASRPPAGSRHCPAASSTVRPSGKRGVISRVRNRVQAVSLTPRWPRTLRPNINSIRCTGCSGALQDAAGVLVKKLAATRPQAAAAPRPMRKPARTPCVIRPSRQRLADLLSHLLGIAQQHHRVVAVEQRIVDAGISGGKRALVEHDGA